MNKWCQRHSQETIPMSICKLEVIIECIMWTWASRLNTAPSSWFIVKITLTGLIIQKTKWTSIQWPGGSFQILFLFYPQSWPVIHRDPLWLAKNKSPFTVLLPIVRLFSESYFLERFFPLSLSSITFFIIPQRVTHFCPANSHSLSPLRGVALVQLKCPSSHMTQNETWQGIQFRSFWFLCEYLV